MTPKDWIVYLSPSDEFKLTHAVLDTHEGMDVLMHKEGNKIIGYVTAGNEKTAVDYGDQVLR
ncbi:MAG: hypothetical protein JRE23_03265 [Deltaproteobacteria bacterium]|nr:hypothetical protein [Deltaproteobacteria bacterium]